MIRLNPELIMALNKPGKVLANPNDPVSGTWHGALEMLGPDGESHSMDLVLELTLDSDNSVEGTAEMGMFGMVELVGTWSPDSNTLTLTPRDEEDETPLVLTIADNQMTGNMTQGAMSMTISASRSHSGGNGEEGQDQAEEDVAQDEDADVDHQADADNADDMVDVNSTTKSTSSNKGDTQYLDGVPEEFIGPLLKLSLIHI